MTSVKIEQDVTSMDVDDSTAKQDLTSMVAESCNILDDPDDEIVRSIDVFVSPKLAEQIYLMQFPLQHSNVPQPQSARIKKRHGLLELEHPLPSNIGSEGNFYLASRKQISQTIPVCTHMALGKFNEDGTEMHLVPLSHITQMRPSFEHVDESDQQVTDEEETKREEARKKKSNEKRPLMLQKKESEKAAMRRKSSYAYKKASELEEQWQDLTICGSRTPEYKLTQEAIYGSISSQSVSIASKENKNFVKKLDYIPGKNDFEKSEMLDGVSPLVKIVTKLTKMIHRGVPVTYSVIRPQFPTSVVDDRDLIQCLSSCAVLVRGNFYLQSRLLNWDPEVAEARTFILYILHTFGVLQRKGIEAVYKKKNNSVTSDWISLILKQVGEHCRNGWIPRLADNLQFSQDFMEQTQLHNQFWERKSKKFQMELQIYSDNILK